MYQEQKWLILMMMVVVIVGIRVKVNDGADHKHHEPARVQRAVTGNVFAGQVQN